MGKDPSVCQSDAEGVGAASSGSGGGGMGVQGFVDDAEDATRRAPVMSWTSPSTGSRPSASRFVSEKEWLRLRRFEHLSMHAEEELEAVWSAGFPAPSNWSQIEQSWPEHRWQADDDEDDGDEGQQIGQIGFSFSPSSGL